MITHECMQNKEKHKLEMLLQLWLLNTNGTYRQTQH